MPSNQHIEQMPGRTMPDDRIGIRLTKAFDITPDPSPSRRDEYAVVIPGGCLCQAVANDSALIPEGLDSLTCPQHPERTFFRGPSGMFS